MEGFQEEHMEAAVLRTLPEFPSRAHVPMTLWLLRGERLWTFVSVQPLERCTWLRRFVRVCDPWHRRILFAPLEKRWADVPFTEAGREVVAVLLDVDPFACGGFFVELARQWREVSRDPAVVEFVGRVASYIPFTGCLCPLLREVAMHASEVLKEPTGRQLCDHLATFVQSYVDPLTFCYALYQKDAQESQALGKGKARRRGGDASERVQEAPSVFAGLHGQDGRESGRGEAASPLPVPA